MINILIIYTGGTIGMVNDPASGALKPFNLDQISQQVPELQRFGYKLDVHSFSPLVDSSTVQPDFWVKLATIIEQEYSKYDGFVILHGTDTMSYSASALSFMLEGLDKPVVLTGSQLPIGEVRTDARENLITAIEIAAAKENGKAIVPEVCVFFDYKLMRGNRTTKFSASRYEAFQSPNYPVLAEAGVHIKYNYSAILSANSDKLSIHKAFDNNIALLKIYPGISPQFIESVVNTANLKAIVIETFGVGNAPLEDWFLNPLRSAVDKGIIIFNVTQCEEGSVEQGRYETSTELQKLGAISGADITSEAAITKLMHLLGKGLKHEEIKERLARNLRGEMHLL